MNARTSAPGSRSQRAAQRRQMLAEHRLQLAGVPETELPQQGSDRRGRIHPVEHGLHTAARTTSRSSILSAPAHMPANSVTNFGAGFADPDLIFGSAMRTFAASSCGKPVWAASSSPAPARHTTRDCHHRTPPTARRTCAKLAPEVPFRAGPDCFLRTQSSQFRGHFPHIDTRNGHQFIGGSKLSGWCPIVCGWVPGMASMSSLCGDAVLFAGVAAMAQSLCSTVG